jgi:hypothetical protein
VPIRVDPLQLPTTLAPAICTPYVLDQIALQSGGWTPPLVVWAPDGGQVLFGSNRHPTRAYTSDGERIENPGSLPQLLGSATWQPLHEATDD